MTILVDGPSAVDIEQLTTELIRDTTPSAFGPVASSTTTIHGTFKLSSCFSGTKQHSGVDTHKDSLEIIAYLEDKPKKACYLTGCHITSQTINKHGSHFKFTAENMRFETI